MQSYLGQNREGQDLLNPNATSTHQAGRILDAVCCVGKGVCMEYTTGEVVNEDHAPVKACYRWENRVPATVKDETSGRGIQSEPTIAPGTQRLDRMAIRKA